MCYAVDAEDRYVLAKSEGWEVEKLATEQALLAQEEQVEAIRQRVVAGELAPLAYHMATHQMPLKLFAQSVGIARWRVRRHLSPAVFARLAPKWLSRYADCLELSVDVLCVVPDQQTRVFFEPDDA